MKKFIIVVILLFSFSSICRGEYEWTLIVDGHEGDSFFLDLNTIDKKGNYVYYWGLNNYIKPSTNGFLSTIEYVQADCKLIKDRLLKQYFSETPMAGRIVAKYEEPLEWSKPYEPKSIAGIMISVACNH